jgi:hypothetical protein
MKLRGVSGSIWRRYAGCALAMLGAASVLAILASGADDPYPFLVSAGILMFAMFCGVVWTAAERLFKEPEGPQRPPRD